MKTLTILWMIAAFTAAAPAQGGENITVWVDGVQQADHSGGHPVAPQGFYQDPNWLTPDGWESYWDTYRNDGTIERDPNHVNHGLEFIPYRADPERFPRVYMCWARQGSDGEVDITGPFSQVSWRWDNEGPEHYELWTHDKSVWTDRIFGGESQRHNAMDPPQEQCYYLGTIYVYVDVTFADFARHWKSTTFPALDFNGNGVVDLEDMMTFITEVMY